MSNLKSQNLSKAVDKGLPPSDVKALQAENKLLRDKLNDRILIKFGDNDYRNIPAYLVSHIEEGYATILDHKYSIGCDCHDRNDFEHIECDVDCDINTSYLVCNHCNRSHDIEPDSVEV